jgi:hypothetical protein
MSLKNWAYQFFEDTMSLSELCNRQVLGEWWDSVEFKASDSFKI